MALDLLTYNGFPLDIMTTKGISRTHKFSDDRTIYHFTEWVFNTRTVINPNTLGILSGKPNLPPALVDSVLRSFLTPPRKALVFSQSMDGQNWNVVLNVPNNPANLTTPSLGRQPPQNQLDQLAGNVPGGTTFLTDAANGPFVDNFNVLQDVSGHTWTVEMRITARVRECAFLNSPGEVLKSNPIISNRWTRRMDTDDQHLSYIQTDGEVVFDSAWLLALGPGADTSQPGVIKWNRVPDQYRIDLFQPIPPNCVRDHINVVQMSDGITFGYSFRDQEQFFNSLPACRFEAYQTEGFSQMSQEQAIATSIVSHLSDPHSAVNAFGIGGFLNTRFQTIIRSIPKFHSHILVRAWGNRITPKWTLLAQAISIATTRVINLRSVELLITWENSGKFVEVQMTNRSGPEEALPFLKNAITDSLSAIKSFVQNAFAGNVNLATLFTAQGIPGIPAGFLQTLNKLLNQTDENDVVDGWFDQDEQKVRQAFINRVNNSAAWQAAFPDGPDAGRRKFYGNMNPPNSGNTRGTFVCSLIAQALHSPCTPPPCPPDPIVKPDIQICGTPGQSPSRPPLPLPPIPPDGSNVTPGNPSLQTIIGTPNNTPPILSAPIR